MYLTALGKGTLMRCLYPPPSIYRAMKLSVLLLLGFCLQAGANGYSQTVSLSVKNEPLTKIFKEIKKQTGVSFIYGKHFVSDASRVSLDVKNQPLDKVLDLLFKDMPLAYEIDNGFVVLSPKVVSNNPPPPAKENLPLPPITVRGRIVNENGEGVTASVLVKGTKNGTASNSDGYFELKEVDEKATLVISGVSIETQEVKVDNRATINITAKIKVGEGEEVIVAYNKISARSNVGAVTVVKGEEIQKLPNRSFDKSLQGLVPGLQITQGTGQPGGGVANFVLRGIATGADPSLGTQARHPLIVMDGIPLSQEPISTSSAIAGVPNNNPLAQLNPSDIETITVLRDASAIALYGSRASNGVILVTTKKGKEGKTRIGFRHQTDISERLKGNQDMLNQQGYLELLYEAYRNTNPAQYTDAAILADLKTKFPTRADGSFYPQEDWLGTLYRNNALTISNELSVSGGNARQIFYLNLEYTKQNGIEKSTGFDRKSIRFNYESRPMNWLKLGINTTGSYSVQEVGSGRSENSANRISPLNPIRNENGNFIYQYQWGGANASNPNTISSFSINPVAEQELGLNRNVAYRSMARLIAEARFLKYFTFSTLSGADLMVTESKERVHPKFSETFGLAVNTGRLTRRNTRSANLITTNTLRFDRKWSRGHSLNILAAHEAQIKTNNFISLTKNNISTNPLTEELVAGTSVTGAGLSTKETLLSYFGQVNYGFKERYFFSGSVRTDGSSLFGDNNRFGSHWSVGGGWIVSSERFLRSANKWLNYLKLRGSIGSAGNSSAIINTLRYHQLYLFDLAGQIAVASDPSTAPNPGIRWEKTLSWDAGIDAKLFKERLTIGVDVYNRKTTDVLGTFAIAPATGYTTLKGNIGDLKNYGIELSFSATVLKIKDFQWNIAGNWAMNKNRLVKSYYEKETVGGSPSVVTATSISANVRGENYNSFYLVQWAGVDPATGKPLWIDSTGKPSSNWAAAKPVIAGKPQPDGFGSFSQNFSWKSITLSMIFNYQYGFQVYADPGNNPIVNDGIDPFINQGTSALDRWQKPGDIAANPRRLLFGSVGGVSDNATAHSTRYLIDGDFVRLANLSLAWQLPANMIKRLHLSSANIYLQGSNLTTWTKYTGRQDAENASSVGRASAIYPLQRAYSIGVNVNF